MTCLQTKDFTDVVETDETWGLGTMKNSAGTLQWNPHNLLLSSEDLSSSDWTKTDTTVTSNAATAPDGTLTADKISHTSTNAYIFQDHTPVTATYMIGFCAKYIDHQWMHVYADGDDTWIDLQNKVIGTEDTVDATLVELDDDWVYVTIPWSATAGATSILWYLADGDASTTETSGTSAYIWGAHLYRNDLGGMATVPTSDRALAALEYYVPNKAVVTGSNLVSNGTFDSSTAGWTADDGATLSVVSGKLRVTEDGVDGTAARAYQIIDTVVGEHYKLSGDLGAATSGTCVLAASTNTSTSGTPQYSDTDVDGVSVYFTASTTTTYIVAATSFTTARTADFDNITVEQVDRNPSAARYLPRRENHEYDGSAWVKGLLVEPDGATNLVTYSEDLSNAAWTKSGAVSIDTPLVTHGISLDYIRNTGTASFVSLVQSTGSIADDGYLVVSCFIKDGDSSETAIRIDDAGSNHCTVPITWTSGVPSLQAQAITGLTYVDGDVIDHGDGVYRVWFAVRNKTGGALTLNHEYYVTWNDTPAAADEYTYAGGFQAELGLVPTSHIPTSGASVSRGAETTTIPASVMDSLGLFNTVAVDGTELVTNGTFDADSDWTKDTGWTIGSGVASCDGSQGGNTDLTQSPALAAVVGKVYQVTFTLSNFANGDVEWRFGGAVGTAQTVDGTYSEVLVATNNSGFEMRGNYLFAGDIDNISIKEIHRRGIGVQMHGYMSYGDEGAYQTVEFARCYASADNYLLAALDTNGADAGGLSFHQESGGTLDSATGTDDYSPDVMVPFKLAGRWLDNSLQGAADGTATTENTTPIGLPDLTGVDMDIAYSGPALHITKFNIFAENIPDSVGNFKMTQAFVEKGSS